MICLAGSNGQWKRSWRCDRRRRPKAFSSMLKRWFRPWNWKPHTLLHLLGLVSNKRSTTTLCSHTRNPKIVEWYAPRNITCKSNSGRIGARPVAMRICCIINRTRDKYKTTFQSSCVIWHRERSTSMELEHCPSRSFLDHCHSQPCSCRIRDATCAREDDWGSGDFGTVEKRRQRKRSQRRRCATKQHSKIKVQIQKMRRDSMGPFVWTDRPFFWRREKKAWSRLEPKWLRKIFPQVGVNIKNIWNHQLDDGMHRFMKTCLYQGIQGNLSWDGEVTQGSVTSN